jgi:glycine/D-amino acid oxidase-like deaminating enzyme
MHDDAATQWGVSLWHASVSPSLRPRLEGERKSDLAVIGGGFTGLSTALHAERAGLSVVLLEAKNIAWGASGRNAGFVVPNFAKMDPDAIVSRLGEERGERLIGLAGRGADKVFGLIAEFDIDCDAQQSGWIQPAHAKKILPQIEARFAQWAKRGRPVEWLDADAVTRMTGCRGYAGGWIDRSGGVINPVKYALGLADAAERSGAAIFEDSTVTGIKRLGANWALTTASGSVVAEKVIVATNALGGNLLPQLSRAFIPLKIYQIATQPLPMAVRQRILPGGQCVSDTRRNLFTFRLDAQNRLITGGMNVLDAGADRRVPRTIHRRLASLLDLPDLPPLAFAWSGLAAITPDFLPHLLDLGPGLVAAIGCNGRGIAITTMLGEVLADWAHGAAPDDLAVPYGPPSVLPRLARYAPQMLLPISMLRDAMEVGRWG